MIPILGRGPRLVIQIKHSGGEEGDPSLLEFRLHGGDEEIALATLAAAEIGLPETYGTLLSRREPPEFHLPAGTRDAIADQLSATHRHGDPLWISFDAPRRMTVLVPWERLLAPMRLGPWLRAPQLPLVPVSSRDVHRVAFCANVTDGRTASALTETAALFRRSLEIEHGDRPIEAYLFFNGGSNALAGARDAFSSVMQGLRLLSVKEFINNGEPVPTTDALGEAVLQPRHPWLRWIKSALNGSGIDRVVFLGEAQLFPGRAALALEFVRSGKPAVELVRADEFDLFLTQLGACRVDLHSVRPGWSDIAMRLFAEDLSWTTPATVTAYEAGDARGLAGTLKSHSAEDHAAPFATRYAAENRRIEWEERPDAEVAGLEQFTLARPSLRRLLENGPAQGWFGAVQRRLERQVAGLLRDQFTTVSEPSEAYRLRRQGIEAGMVSVVAAVERHIDQFGPGSATEVVPPSSPAPDKNRPASQDEVERLSYAGR